MSIQCTQFTMKVHIPIYSTYTISQRIYTILYKVHNFQKMLTIMYIQCTQFFSYKKGYTVFQRMYPICTFNVNNVDTVFCPPSICVSDSKIFKK